MDMSIAFEEAILLLLGSGAENAADRKHEQ
jgi:hypothetical protein